MGRMHYFLSLCNLLGIVRSSIVCSIPKKTRGNHWMVTSKSPIRSVWLLLHSCTYHVHCISYINSAITIKTKKIYSEIGLCALFTVKGCSELIHWLDFFPLRQYTTYTGSNFPIDFVLWDLWSQLMLWPPITQKLLALMVSNFGFTIKCCREYSVCVCERDHTPL